jgi:hypothetical protein
MKYARKLAELIHKIAAISTRLRRNISWREPRISLAGLVTDPLAG